MQRWRIVTSFLIGPLLEASVPKPGNVNRFRDFKDLTLYHFILGDTTVAGVYYEAVKRGELLRKGLLKPSEAGIGELIRRGVSVSKEVQDANPNFGVIVLSVPLMMGLAMGRDMLDARKKTKLLIEESTVRDTMELYRAIRIANPKGIPSGVKYDVYSDESFEELFKDRVNLLRLAEISCERELIFCEWLNSYELSYSTFARLYDLVKELPLEEAVQKVFLKLLAEKTDTLIQRKAGKKEAELVRISAKKVIEGEMELREFDDFLREKGDLRNPGSIADITAMALSLLSLRGVRLEMRERKAWLVTSRP